MKRKDFLTQILVGGSVLLSSPLVFNSCSSGDDIIPDDNNNSGGSGNGITVDLTDSNFSQLASVGGFAYKNNIIIIHSTENNFVALSKICTHTGCTVDYSHSSSNLPCPCHGSKFDIDGKVLNGPASSPLKKYSVQKNGSILTIS